MGAAFQLDLGGYDFRQLAQSRPSNTSAVSLVSPSADTDKIILTTIIIANTTSSAAKYSVFHDVDGTTYDQSTALAYEVSLAANSVVELEWPLALPISAGNLAVQSGTGNALTYTAYGFMKSQ